MRFTSLTKQDKVRMHLDTSGSKTTKMLNASRWMFISTRTDAIVFLFAFLMFIITNALFYLYDSSDWLIKRYHSITYNPVSQLKKKERFSNVSLNVLLLGGSTSRELIGDGVRFSERLSAACDEGVEFVNAGFRNQTYVNSVSLYDEFNSRGVDLVVVGMNYYRLIIARAALQTDMLNSDQIVPIPFHLTLEEFPETQILPSIQPINLLAKLDQFLNVTKSIRLGVAPEPKPTNEFVSFQNVYKPPAMSLERKQQTVRRFLLSRLPDYLNNSGDGIDRWITFSEYAQKKGSRVLFLALPEDTTMEKVRPFFELEFMNFKKRAAATGAGFVDWRQVNLNLEANDFYDQQHLLPTGREKIVDHLVSLFAKNLKTCRKH
jgi:hypothetical protein